MDLVPTSLLQLTANIVVAHLSKSNVSYEELPELIRSVYAALSEPGFESTTPAVRPLVPAVPIKASVFPDYIVCLEDGKQLKMLKRYLETRHGLTVDQYRTKWGLPSHYPVVAPNYAKHRSNLAKQLGLGRKPVVSSDGPETRRASRGGSSRKQGSRAAG